MRRTLIATILVALATTALANDREQELSKALAYLRTSVDEVAWVKFERNNAHVGLKERPSDLRLLCATAAMNGNRAMDFGCHVWFYDTSRAASPTTNVDLAFCECTARYGKVQDNHCH